MFLRHQVLDDIDNFSEGGIKGIGCRKKVSQMRWCLAEAQRDRYRAALLSATTVTLKQDKRKGTRFIMRFKCCDSKLQVTEGTLQTRRHVGGPAADASGADGLRLATMQGLKSISTPAAPPHWSAEARKEAEKRLDPLRSFFVSS